MFEDRQISVKTPLPDEDLMFAQMTGFDEVSQCFAFDLAMVSEDMDIKAEDLLGHPITVRVGKDERERFFHGLVAEFSLEDITDGFAHYGAVLRPWLWFLSKTSDNRIFQNMSVIEIIEEIFGSYPTAKFEKRLQETYDPREYCVQYDESDLHFVQRLMEHEGIFYFFDYDDGEHTLVLTDTVTKLVPNPDLDEIKFQPDKLLTFQDGDYITQWTRRASVQTGTASHTDYDFTKPAADLMSKSESLLGHELDDGEAYHYPSNHTELSRGDILSAIRIEELQSPAQRVQAAGTVNGVWSGVTFALVEYPREAENDEFAILRVDYAMWDDQYASGTDRKGEGFEVTLQLAPSSIAFRPERRTPKPVMRGPQTATVVGPGGEEIFTDEYARVKVQFHWDRLGARDENASCFVRVSSVWAGAGWGFIQIPRIGQEVIVDFLEGDPDQPLITGRVYNASQMPPYGLPDNATQSGWKSNSSPGGGGFNELRFEDKAGSEEVYFQAEKDHTELVKNDESRLIQHDMSERVDNISTQSIGVDRFEDVGNNKETSVGVDRSVAIGNNDTETVGTNRSLTVGVDEKISIGSNSTETIGSNHTQSVGIVQTITVGAARVDTVGAAENRTVGAAQSQSVGATRDVSVGASQSHSVGTSDSWTIGSDQTVKVGANQSIEIGSNQTVQIGADNSVSVGGACTTSVAKANTLSVGEDMAAKVGKTLVFDVADQITLKCGSASIMMKKDGTIAVEGKDISIKGSGKINVKASSDITMKGSKISQN